MDPEAHDVIPSIIRSSLADLLRVPTLQIRFRTSLLSPYYSVGPIMGPLNASDFPHSLRQEFLLRLHMLYLVTTISEERYWAEEVPSKRNQAGEGEEIRQWYMTAFQRLVIITKKLFDDAQTLNSVALLPCFDSILKGFIPSYPSMFLIESDNLQTLLFSNELKEWSNEDQKAIVAGTYWTSRHKLLYKQLGISLRE